MTAPQAATAAARRRYRAIGRRRSKETIILQRKLRYFRGAASRRYMPLETVARIAAL